MKMTSRADQIASIIQSRRPLAERVSQVQANLSRLGATLTSLEQQRDQIIRDGDAEISGRLRDLDFSTLQRRIAAEQDSLEKLKRRFVRDTLNIGVIGRARQGKSRLLQSLSGLSATEIPDGDRQHCTGVRSTIYHNATVTSYGEVWFYTERSFLDDVIAPYYLQLDLGPAPETLSELMRRPIPELTTDDTILNAKYQHLCRYREHLEHYKHLLATPSPRRISPQDIRAYVAQDTPDGKRIYHNYLAVRDVRIVCSFPYSDVGQVAMIDLPGLGDTGIGDQERLVRTLSDDVDVVLFVRMPRSIGDHWSDVDVQLYNLARLALTDLPLDRWAFMLLNRTGKQSKNGDNTNNCRDLQETLDTVGYMKFVECLVADCANSAEVNRVALHRILDYLAEHMPVLDQRYALACQDRLWSLQQEVYAELEKARGALGFAPTQASEFPLFKRLFDEVWDNLTTGLDLLLKELKDRRDEENPIFQAAVEQALETARIETGVPTLEEIETRGHALGGLRIAYLMYLNELRTHITRQFMALDDSLKRAIEEVKDRVAPVVIQQGRLGRLTSARGVNFLRAMADLMPGNLQQIRTAFYTLADFELSYRGFIQYRIRRNLDGLTPDEGNLPLSDRTSAEEILDYLRSLHRETLYKVRLALRNWLADPNAAAFAMVEEFTDQILRARDARGEWEQFYYEVRAEIWSSEFQKFGERSRIRRQWQEAVQRAADANHESRFDLSV